MSLLHHIRSLHSLAPANKDHVSAWRVAISVAVPSLALLAAGRPELTGYAVFGALTGMYGRTEPHQLRLRHQGQAAVLLVAGVGVGVFLSAHHIHSWALVVIEAAFAGVGSLFTDKTALKPAGPFFGILALGACASVPAAVPWHTGLLIAARIGRVLHHGRLWRLVPWPHLAAREAAGRRGAARGTAAGRRGFMPPATSPPSAPPAPSGSSAAAATRTGPWPRRRCRLPGRTCPAACTAASTGSSAHSSASWWSRRSCSRGRGHRCWPSPGRRPPSWLCLVIVLQFSTELFMTRHYGLAMVSFTPVILLVGQLAAPADPAVLVTERAVETLVGAAVGIAVVVLIRRRRPAVR